VPAVHETSIAISIYETAKETVAQYPDACLDSVKIAVGELSAVEPELIQFAWQALVHEGPDEGTHLEIEWRPARQFCSHCGEVEGHSAGSWLRLCEQCGSPLRIEGGSELDILEISIITKDETPDVQDTN
jgi:hydrogenase nickel insertion protein HypA